ENKPGHVSAIKNAHGKNSVSVVRLVMPRRPLLLHHFVLRDERIAEETLRIDSFSGVVRTGVDAARRGELRAKIAGVRFIDGRIFLLDLDLGRNAFLR